MTTAGVFVYNELPANLNCSLGSNTQDMDDDNFLNTTIDVNNNIYGVIDAGDWPEQSILQLNFNAAGLEGQATVDLGEGFYSTNIVSYNPAGQVGVLLAPLPTTDVSVPGYYFYFLCSNGVLTNVVNSLLQANVAALVDAYINSNPAPVPGINMTITSINYGNLNCSYAGLSNQGNNVMGFSMIAQSDILSCAGTSSGNPASITLDNLSVMLQGTVAFSGSGSLTVIVDTLKCSLGNFNIEGLNIAILNDVTSATDLAGLINDTNLYPINKFMIQLINAAIAKALSNMSGTATNTITQKIKEYAN